MRVSKVLVLNVWLLVLLASVATTWALETLGTVRFGYTVVEEVLMSPSTVQLNLHAGQPIVNGTAYSDSAIDTGTDLIVRKVSDITVTISGIEDFSAFSCTVELKKDATVVKSATVSKTTLSATMTSVPIDTYNIWVTCTYTAQEVGAGTVTLSIQR